MSPLAEDRKGSSGKGLVVGDSVVDSKTDSKKPETVPNQAKIDTSELPPELSEITAAWPELPEHIKATILTLVRASRGE